MSKNASRRGVREFLSSKCRRIRNRLDHSVPASNKSLSDQCVLPPAQENPSSFSRIAAASSLNIILALPQARNNEVLNQIHGQEDFEKSSLEGLSQQVNANVSGVVDHSLRALAYEDLRVMNPELVERFNYCLGISTISDKVNGESANLSIEKEHLDKTTPIRKCFEQTIKVIFASKDYISSAVSVNPYAALAWTGISLLLPLLLNPTQGNEAPIRGLNYIANLIVVYRWQEKIYLHDDDASSDFRDLAERLDTKILEYEATLLIHTQQNLPKRWVRNVFQAGYWASQVEIMKSYDAK
ncbi:hypothetical protein MMC14_006206 [Varicellaria rhodocarpa]|nr:hypothetical protein [Varicellaria rhodocarpa]